MATLLAHIRVREGAETLWESIIEDMVAKTFEKCNDIIENDLNCPISNETKKLYQDLISS